MLRNFLSPAAGFFSFLLLQKNPVFRRDLRQKSSPPNENTPFGGGTLMELWYYCKLKICSLMLNENSHCFYISKAQSFIPSV